MSCVCAPVRLIAFAFVTVTMIADAEFVYADRPTAIEAINVPEIPAEIEGSLRPYLNVRQAYFAGWNPLGEGMLVRTRFGNASQLHQVLAPGGARQQKTFFKEPVRGGYLPNSSDLMVRMSAGGNENYQLWHISADTGVSRLVTDGKSRNMLGKVTKDGKRFAYTSNRRNGRDFDVYVGELAAPAPSKAAPVMETSGEFFVVADWSPDERHLLLQHYVSINESYAWLLDLETRQKTQIEIPGPKQVAIGSLAFSADGKSVYMAVDARGDFTELVRYSLQDKTFEWLTGEIKWNVESIAIDDTSGAVAVVTNTDGSSKLSLLKEGQLETLETPLGILSGLEFSPDGKQLGFTLARPEAPSDAYSLDLATKKLTRWTNSEIGGLDPSRFVSPKLIRYETFDGRKIPAYYYPPKNAGDTPAPVLILIHGGPEGQYRPSFSSTIQYFAVELGLAVICPNVRGSAGYGKSYLKLDNGPLREQSVQDIGKLLDWISQQKELDSERVGVLGGSYGGYMVLASLCHFPERIRAGIDVVGIASFTTFLKNTAAYRRDLRRAEYGDERDPKMAAVFEKINPTNNAHKIRAELLVVHGKNDPRVPFSEAEQIVEIVSKQGKSVWAVYAENEGHGFAKRDNRDYLLMVEALFLQTRLIDSE